MRKFAVISFIATLAIFIFLLSCNKSDTTARQQDVFDIAGAKEWWYGTFKKSSEYKEVNYSNLFTAPANLGIKATKKYPAWKMGVSYKKGNLEVVELPLYYNNPVSIFPGSAEFSENERRRIARATLQKALLVKKGGGTVFVRIAMFIPSPAYAKSKNYDISNNTMQSPANDFSGWLVIKRWDESVIEWWEIKNGRKVKKLHLVTSDTKINQRGQMEVCYPQTVLVEVPICVGDVIVGDDPNTDVDECTEWSYQTHEQTQWVCDEVGNEEDDPWGDCLGNGGTPESCFCDLIGDCNGGGGGYEEPPPLPEVLNNVDDPCLKSSVNNAIALDCKNEISSFINTVFGNSDQFILDFQDNTLIGSQATFDAYTVTGPLNNNNLTTLKTTITLNNPQLNDASKEYIAATILHESIHAWIDYLFPSQPANAEQHNLMAASYRFDMMLNALKQMFPGLNSQDAIDLTWGGLYNSILFNNLSSAERQRIIETNNRYKHRSLPNGKGTPC